MDGYNATLTSQGRYTKFIGRDRAITFMHGKDLVKYLNVKEWDNGYLVVDCLGVIKGEYEDYIDMQFLLENLYMEPEAFLEDIKGVVIKYE